MNTETHTPTLAEEIVQKTTEQIATLIGRQWPEIRRILEKEEEVKLAFSTTITDRNTQPGEQADKSNRIVTAISFSERFTDKVEAAFEDPSQPTFDFTETMIGESNPEESHETPKEAASHEVADELPPEMPPAGDGDAGTTPLGDALDAAAAKLEVPPLKIPLDEPWWQKSGLIAEVKKQGKLAKWPAAAISCLVKLLQDCETLDAAKATLRPHVAQPEAE